jgi:hypothetical protein
MIAGLTFLISLIRANIDMTNPIVLDCSKRDRSVEITREMVIAGLTKEMIEAGLTEEMINAGVNEYLSFDARFEDYEAVVIRIWNTMNAAKT